MSSNLIHTVKNYLFVMIAIVATFSAVLYFEAPLLGLTVNMAKDISIVIAGGTIGFIIQSTGIITKKNALNNYLGIAIVSFFTTPALLLFALTGALGTIGYKKIDITPLESETK